MKNNMKNSKNQNTKTFSDFCCGQKVLYQISEPPYEKVNIYEGLVREVHSDHLIVDIPEISDHCRFEEFNLSFLSIAPRSKNEQLADGIWRKLYSHRDSTAEDEFRFTDEIASELSYCGEDMFLIRHVLQDILEMEIVRDF